MSHPTPLRAPRAAVLLGGWLAATFAWGPALGFGLLVAALVAGALGAPAVAYGCLAALVAGVGWGFAGSGVWLWLLGVAVFRAEWRGGRFVSACLRLVMWLLAGLFLVYSGGSAVWAFCTHWPPGYWPGGRAPLP